MIRDFIFEHPIGAFWICVGIYWGIFSIIQHIKKP